MVKNSVPTITRYGRDPLVDLELANKRYVDNKQGGKTFAAIVKSVDEIINNSSTLQDDDELFFEAKANKAYFVSFFLIQHSESSAPNFKTGWSIPSGATMIDGASPISYRGTTGAVFVTDSTVAKTLTTSLGSRSNGFCFQLLIGATAGTVNFQWAQGNATAEDSTCQRGATLLVWESA